MCELGRAGGLERGAGKFRGPLDGASHPAQPLLIASTRDAKIIEEPTVAGWTRTSC
jgi:hypothetical protein